MKFTIFPATGGIDRRFLEQAVAASHDPVETEGDPEREPTDAHVRNTTDTADQTIARRQASA